MSDRMRTMKPSNANTRALTSALRSDLVELRAVAARILDEAVGHADNPVGALMVAFDTSHVTAASLLAERERVTKSGKRRRKR